MPRPRDPSPGAPTPSRCPRPASSPADRLARCRDGDRFLRGWRPFFRRYLGKHALSPVSSNDPSISPAVRKITGCGGRPCSAVLNWRTTLAGYRLYADLRQPTPDGASAPDHFILATKMYTSCASQGSAVVAGFPFTLRQAKGERKILNLMAGGRWMRPKLAIREAPQAWLRRLSRAKCRPFSGVCASVTAGRDRTDGASWP